MCRSCQLIAATRARSRLLCEFPASRRCFGCVLRVIKALAKNHPHNGGWLRGSSVNGLRRFLTAWMLAVGFVLVASDVSAADLSLPAGSRVGIIVMMSTDVTHYHVGKTRREASCARTVCSGPPPELIDDPLAEEVKKAGFEPVFLDAPELLRRQSRPWFINTSQAARLPNAAMEEVQRIITAENLKAIIIVAPGPNANPESVAGNRLRRLPVYVQGWGFSTSDEPNGIEKPVVFNLVQMLLFGSTGNNLELAFREWGGGFVYEWANFSPGADLEDAAGGGDRQVPPGDFGRAPAADRAADASHQGRRLELGLVRARPAGRGSSA